MQGLAIYLLLQLYFFIDKRSTPLLKFKIYYAANLCLFAGFMLTFFHHYQPIQVASFKPDFFPGKIGNNVSVVITKPNLWFQLSFWTSHYAYLISGFYLMGLLFCMLKLAIGLINISWFRSNKILKLDDYLTKISIQLSSNFRLIKTVLVFVSDKISVPLTIGFIKPIIVFPVALLNQLSVAQTEAILLHELAHIKRNDYLLNLLLCIIQSFLFFNPAIWLMRREIDNYREQCCDDLVLNNTQHKIAYARALLLIEESRSKQLTLTLASNGKKYNLLNRIKRITKIQNNDPYCPNKVVVLLFTLIVIGALVAWNLPAKKSHMLHKLKIEVIKSNGLKTVISADKAEMIKRTKQAPFLLSANKLKIQPNNKSSKKYTINGINLEFNPLKDTVIQSKNKFKIVLEDSTGNKKEYNSINELPEADQKEFLKQYWNADQAKNSQLNQFKIDTNQFVSVKKYFNSPQYKKQVKELFKQMNSSEYKVELSKQLEKMKALSEVFDSPEYKNQMKLLVDSARRKWKSSMNYQPIPKLTPIIIKPERLN
ncbi:MAG: M56 family metallopeptidase [Janthinobacterium lividum]